MKFEVELIDFKPKQKEVWELSTEERVAAAKKFKDEGNAAFKAKNLPAALHAYEEVCSPLVTAQFIVKNMNNFSEFAGGAVRSWSQCSHW